MIKINDKTYKEIVVINENKEVLAMITDVGEIVENDGIKVICVPNKN